VPSQRPGSDRRIFLAKGTIQIRVMVVNVRGILASNMMLPRQSDAFRKPSKHIVLDGKFWPE
jgi:hypothetical protein